MTTYYIDYEAGSDSNDGLSTSTPFKHAPRDDAAGGNVPASWAGGNEYVFKGGVEYLGTSTQFVKCVLYIPDDGTSGNRIHLISGHVHSSAWGTGRAIIDGESDTGGDKQRGVYMNGAAYVTVEGLEVRNIGRQSSPQNSTAGIMWDQSGASNGHALNNYVHDINYFVGGTYATGWGIVSSRGDDCIIEFNDIRRTSDKGVSLFGGGQDPNPNALRCIVRHNYLDELNGHGIACSVDQCEFYGNIIKRTARGVIQNLGGEGVALKLEQARDNKVYNNLIVDCYCGLLQGAGRDNEYYHNTIYGVGIDPGGTLTRFQAGLALGWNGGDSYPEPRITGNKFYNNSIHYCEGIDGPDSNRSQFISICGDQIGNGTANEFRNNSFYGASGDTASTPDRCVSFASNNWTGGPTFYNLTLFETTFAASPYNGIASGNIAADQLHKGGSLAALTNIPTGFLADNTTPNDDGLDLTDASPNVGAGVPLAAPYDTDIEGVGRTNWTIGAYEVGQIFFVDYQNGDDLNDGKTTTSAFKHLPADDAASGNVPTNFAAGDTWVLRGGVSYLGTATNDGNARCVVVRDVNGTETAPITIISGHKYAVPWGVSRAVIDGESTRLTGLYVRSAAWGVLDGVEIRNLGAPTADAHGIRFSQGTETDWLIEDCEIHDINWDNIASYLAGSGILAFKATRHIYRNNEIYNVSEYGIQDQSSGLENDGGTDSHMQSNVIRDTAAHGIRIMGDNWKIEGNIINDVSRGDTAIPNAPMFGFAIRCDRSSNNKIWNNIIARCRAGIALNNGRNNEVYHNIIYGVGIYGDQASSRTRGGIVIGADNSGWASPASDGHKVTNNSIHHVIDPNDLVAGAKFICSNGIPATAAAIEVKNNIAYGIAGDVVTTGDRCVISGNEFSFAGTRTGYSLSGWETEFNLTHNGDASGGLVDDQDYKGGSLGALSSRPTGFLADGFSPNDDGFELFRGSPAMSAGLALAAEFNSDIVRNPRNAWSLGTYEQTTLTVALIGQASARRALLLLLLGQAELVNAVVVVPRGTSEAGAQVALAQPGAAESAQGVSGAPRGQAESRGRASAQKRGTVECGAFLLVVPIGGAESLTPAEAVKAGIAESNAAVFQAPKVGQAEARAQFTSGQGGQAESKAAVAMRGIGQAEARQALKYLKAGGAEALRGLAEFQKAGVVEALEGAAYPKAGVAESIDPLVHLGLMGQEVGIASHITTEVGIRSWIK